MGVRINYWVASVAIATLSTITAFQANAQERPAPFQPRQSVPKAVDEAFLGDNDSFPYKNLSRPIEVLIGTPGFPENLIAKDGERIHRVYQDLLTQQVSSDPLIRTADLPNPYNSSILTMPTSSNRVMGSEFAIQQQPQFTPPAPQVTEPQPQLPQRF